VPDDPETRLTLRQADQARTDFAAIESDLEFLMQRHPRVSKTVSKPASAAMTAASRTIRANFVTFGRAQRRK
jgi:hypothetical protein